LMMKVIQTNFAPGKIQRIIGSDEPIAPQFYNKAFGKYDAAVEEGLNTTTQRQMQFAQLLQLREAGVPVPDSVLLEAVTIQDKKKLTDAIQQANEQQQQMQQAQQQAAVEELQARKELAQAKAEADRGLAVERQSRVAENEALAVERMHEARKDDEIGLLNLVKALKEIDSIDLENVSKLVALANMVKSNETNSQQPQGSPAAQTL